MQESRLASWSAVVMVSSVVVLSHGLFGPSPVNYVRIPVIRLMTTSAMTVVPEPCSAFVYTARTALIADPDLIERANTTSDAQPPPGCVAHVGVVRNHP